MICRPGARLADLALLVANTINRHGRNVLVVVLAGINDLTRLRSSGELIVDDLRRRCDRAMLAADVLIEMAENAGAGLCSAQYVL